SILPMLLAPGEQFAVSIDFWHGWTTEIVMTIGVIGLGTLLFVLFRYWSKIYRLFPQKWSFNRAYDQGLVNLERFSNRLTETYMTGSIRDYLVYIFTFMIASLGYAMFRTGSFTWTADYVADITFYEYILV